MAVRKNYAKLQKKVIQNKRGNLQTVYVKHAEQKKERKNKIGVLELRSELEKLGVSVTIETDNGIHTPKGRKEAEKIYKKLDVLNYIKDHLNVMKKYVKGGNNYDSEFRIRYWKDAEIEINLAIESRNGYGLKVNRAFDFKEKKVTHEIFSMDDKYQGKGIGKELLAIQFREYKKAGMKKVELLANSDIGGYAWAKYGFYATNNSLNNLKKVWAWHNKKNNLWKYEDLTKEDFQLAENVIKKYKKANPTSKTFPMHLIANLHNKKGVHIGKELLLGEEWDAVMDLTNRKQMNMLNKYLKNER